MKNSKYRKYENRIYMCSSLQLLKFIQSERVYLFFIKKRTGI